eukprot:scaffold83393_cov39-Phaeocystis_antarctica.AAC.1
MPCGSGSDAAYRSRSAPGLLTNYYSLCTLYLHESGARGVRVVRVGVRARAKAKARARVRDWALLGLGLSIGAPPREWRYLLLTLHSAPPRGWRPRRRPHRHLAAPRAARTAPSWRPRRPGASPPPPQ